MMPLFVRKEEVTWSQTNDFLNLKVPIKGIKVNKANIVTADNYIRVHYQPFIYEVFLWGEVEDEIGSCRIDETESVVVFEMGKVVKGEEWTSLEKQDLGRNEKRVLRDRAVELTQQRHAARRKALEVKRQEQQQIVVRDQIRLDGEERQRIADIKQRESVKALSELHEWRKFSDKSDSSKSQAASSMNQKENTKGRSTEGSHDGDRLSDPRDTEQNNNQDNHNDRTRAAHNDPNENANDNGHQQNDVQSLPASQLSPGESLLSSLPPKVDLSAALPNSSVDGMDGGLDNEGETGAGSGAGAGKEIWTEADFDCEMDTNKKNCNSIKSLAHKTKRMTSPRTCSQNPIPIRQAGRITVNFTPREFPTPSRESTDAQEQEWLKKQVEARRKCGFNDADLRPEERDPMWLLEKGGSLMGAGSYLGAVSAYSHGIKLAPKMPELYVERAEAHLTLKNLVKAVEDASQGLELLTPKVIANSKDRLKCHSLRAAGFRQLKCYREALMDYEEALKLDPENASLKADAASCEAIIYERDQKGKDTEDEDDEDDHQ